MGYETRYRLDVLNVDDERILKWLADHKTEGHNPFEEPCKWYNHEDDMKELSLAFPGCLFTLHGEGEEAGDLWRKYFRTGLMQVAKAMIIYDPPKI